MRRIAADVLKQQCLAMMINNKGSIRPRLSSNCWADALAEILLWKIVVAFVQGGG
jgi:hypothetical protein